MAEINCYQHMEERYDPPSVERTVTVNNGATDEDGYYMTIRQMTKDDMDGIVACLYMGQGEGCRSEDPLINAIIKALEKASSWR
jgi:hypothetical protein